MNKRKITALLTFLILINNVNFKPNYAYADEGITEIVASNSNLTENETEEPNHNEPLPKVTPSNLPKTTPSNIPKNQTPSTRTSTPPTVTNRTPITVIEPKPNEETKITEQNEIVTNHSPEINGENRINRDIKTGDNFWEILFCSLGVANLLYLLFYKRNKIKNNKLNKKRVV